jgi:hypothetical protein
MDLSAVVQETLAVNVGPFPVPLGAQIRRDRPSQEEGIPEVEYVVPEEYRALYGM